MKILVPEKAVCPKFVSCFHELLNEASVKKQLDKHIISFDENTKQIKRNTGSEFIVQVVVGTVIKAFESAHGKLEYVHNFAQI